MMGQLFHLFEAPNRFGLPAFYTLHVWAWKDNPQGAFVNWHPQVSCDSFAGQNRLRFAADCPKRDQERTKQMRYSIDPKLTSRKRAASSPVSFSPAPWAQPMARASRPPLRRPSSRRRTATLFSWSAPAAGTQGYICLPTSAGAATASWTVRPSRPEATLFQRVFGQDVQIATHFLSPDANPNDAAPNPLPFGNATWQSSFDTSRVWAQVLHSNSIPAGSDPTCPNAGSIPCLLLQSIGSQPGPSGGTIAVEDELHSKVEYPGGVAPADGCSTSADVGSQTLVPYTADYYFYRRTGSGGHDERQGGNVMNQRIWMVIGI